MAAVNPTALREEFLSRYTFVKLLDTTLYGEANLVTDAKGKSLVVKSCSRDLISERKGSSTSDDPLQELELLKDLVGSPYFVQYADSFVNEEWIYIVTEYIPHGDLFSYLNERGKLTEPEIKVIAKQLLAAAVELNRFNLTNLDLSLENIAIQSLGSAAEPQKWTVRVLDLGAVTVAREWMKQAGPGYHPWGKQGYRAPEVELTSRYGSWLPREAQVWTLGIVLYMMGVGSAAFDHPGDYWHRQLVSGAWADPKHMQMLRERDRCAYCHLSSEFLNFLRQLVVSPTQRLLFRQLPEAAWLQN